MVDRTVVQPEVVQQQPQSAERGRPSSFLGKANIRHTATAVVSRFDQSIEAFVPLAMVRGNQTGDIEVVVRYLLVGCFVSQKCLSSTLINLQVQGPVRIMRLMCVLCGVLPHLRLPKQEGEERGRRIEGRELEAVLVRNYSTLYSRGISQSRK